MMEVDEDIAVEKLIPKQNKLLRFEVDVGDLD